MDLWTQVYSQYQQSLSSYGEQYMDFIWSDIEKLTENYILARRECIQYHNNQNYPIERDENQLNNSLRENYESEYSSIDLMRLNQSHLQETKNYFINLIWYNKGKKVNHSDNLSKLLTVFSKILKAINIHNRENSQNIKIEHYKLLATFTQILEGSIPTKLWKNLDLPFNWGEEDFSEIYPSNISQPIISVFRRRNIFEIPWWLVRLIILLSTFAAGAITYRLLAYQFPIFFSSSELKEERVQLERENETLRGIYQSPEFIKVVNDFEKYLTISRDKTKKAIIQRCTQPRKEQQDCLKLLKNLKSNLSTTDKPNPNEERFKDELKKLIKITPKTTQTTTTQTTQIPSLQAGSTQESTITKTPTPTQSPAPAVKAKPTAPPVSEPTPKPNSTNEWKESVYAFNALRDEFVAEGKPQVEVESVIINNTYKGVPYKNIGHEENSWVPKIKKFQTDNGIFPTGYMKQDDPTYQILKCKMVEDLKLTDRFFPLCKNSQPPSGR